MKVVNDKAYKYLQAGHQADKKRAVQAAFVEKERAYRLAKAEEAKKAMLARVAAQPKRNTSDNARQGVNFRMSTQEREELQAVCRVLKINESQFLRDAVRESVMVLAATIETK
jgi:chemotaxis methyl-accepting protein methylase